MKNHQELCLNNEPQIVELPNKSEVTKFKNFQKALRVPFVIYADFEAFQDEKGLKELEDQQKFYQIMCRVVMVYI